VNVNFQTLQKVQKAADVFQGIESSFLSCFWHSTLHFVFLMHLSLIGHQQKNRFNLSPEEHDVSI